MLHRPGSGLLPAGSRYPDQNSLQQPSTMYCPSWRLMVLPRVDAAAEELADLSVTQQSRRLRMVCSYDGSAYAGFQFQPGKVRTVQSELEKAAKRLFLGCSRMVGASRTDGGAHAYGQVVHFDIYGQRDNLETDVLYYNSFLPADVKVHSLAHTADGWDSHFSSVGKTYVYKLASGIPDPTQAKHRWWVYDRYCEQSRGKPSALSDIALDVEAMRQAAALLLGKHDCSAFADQKRAPGLGSQKRKNPKLAERGLVPSRTSVKNTRIICEILVHDSVNAFTGGQEVTLEVTGNGFLYRMVRNIAASLVEVGHRRITARRLQQVLASGDRAALPDSAPPHGLYLARVYYEGDQDFIQRCSAVADLIPELMHTKGHQLAGAAVSSTDVGVLAEKCDGIAVSNLSSEGVEDGVQ